MIKMRSLFIFGYTLSIFILFPPLTLFGNTATPTKRVNEYVHVQPITTTPIAGQTFSIGDLHIHTTCSDGRNDYETMLKQAVKMRYAFIAITDHRLADNSLCKENIRKCREEKRLLCIPGMEVTGRVHLLALGITASINEKLPLKQQVIEIHKQGGIAIAAHPYGVGRLYSDADLFESGLDAVECGGISAVDWRHFGELQKKYHLPCVYNSDAHYVFQMLAYNLCEGKIEKFEDLKQAIQNNSCAN